MKDRGVQINVGAKLGQKTLNISSEKNGEELEIFTNPLTIAIGTAIQKALAKTFEDHPILQRKGQDIFGIEIKVDRKKGLINQTKGTNFFISFDSQKRRKENSGLTTDSSPFHVHRQNTGKSVTIRFARIGEDGNEAVFEVRLLGNNPHSAFFDEYLRQIFNGAQPTVEIFIKNLTDNLKDLEILNEEQKIAIKNDGKIESIEVIYHEEKGNYPDTKITKPYAKTAQSREVILNARGN